MYDDFYLAVPAQGENAKRQITDDNVCTLTRHYSPCYMKQKKIGVRVAYHTTGVGLWGARIRVWGFKAFLSHLLYSTQTQFFPTMDLAYGEVHGRSSGRLMKP